MKRAGSFPLSWALIGEPTDHRHLLKPGLNRVGCLPDGEVVLDAAGVSKRHAVLVVRPDHLSVEDLASKNGTFVNGGRIVQSRIEPGDELRFGPTTLRLKEVPMAESELAISVDPEGPSGWPADPETPFLRHGMPSSPKGRLHDLVFPEGHVRCASPPMAKLYQRLRAVARSDLPILLLGETGVGKEGLARILHESSDRRSAAFVAINCAAIPSELLEAELFGIGKGVATGVAERKGKFEIADGGTLFLDEIGDMPPELQPKLLRTLQEKEIQPLGRPPRQIDVRLVAATNTGLVERIESGGFRQDLYYRLAGLVLTVPPLRERREDIPDLAEHFLRTFAERAGKSIRGITRGALGNLVARPWTGNIRELQHEIQRLVYLCPDYQVIDSDRLVDGSPPLPPAGTRPEPPSAPAPPESSGTLDLESIDSLDLTEIEKQAVTEALRRSRGNRTRAAKYLGISREALRRRIARFGELEN